MSTSVLLSPGETFDGKFVILQSLGSGGMGDVYKCRQVGVERLVALKLLNRVLADTASSLQRFEREAKILSLLDHRGIARFFFYGVSSDKFPFIAMEYVEGDSLRERVRQLGTLAWRDAANIAIQICEALSYAHDRSVIHRDLKPENIILTNGDRVVIIDFGLAKVSDPNWDSLTQTGELIGTTSYLSPELCRGYRPDHRSDLYSLGIILYEMISGVPPFSADHPMGVIYKHAHEDAPRLSVTDLSIPAQVNWIIAKCIAKDPSDRYQSAKELEADLQALISNKISAIEAPSTGSDTAHGARGKQLILLLSVLIIVSSYFVFVAKPRTNKTVANNPESQAFHKRPRKLATSDSQLRQKSLQYILDRFNKLRESNQHAEAQNLVIRWVQAIEKERPLTPSEIGDTACAISRSQAESHDFTSALRTETDALKRLEGHPESNTLAVMLLVAQLAHGPNQSEFTAGGKNSKFQQAANKLQQLLNKTELPEAVLIDAISRVVEAKIHSRQLNDALAIIEKTCSRTTNCIALMRLRAECLFSLDRIEEAKVAAKQYGSYFDFDQYRMQPSKAEQDVWSAYKTAQCAAAASRFDIAAELLEPALKAHENMADSIYGEALVQYSDWISWTSDQKNKNWVTNYPRAAESIQHLKKASRIFQLLGLPARQRSALAKIACYELALGDEKNADDTLHTALNTRDQESADDVKASIAAALLDNLPRIGVLNSSAARLAVLQKANAIFKDVQNDRYATMKAEAEHLLRVEEDASK